MSLKVKNDGDDRDRAASHVRFTQKRTWIGATENVCFVPILL